MKAAVLPKITLMSLALIFAGCFHEKDSLEEQQNNLDTNLALWNEQNIHTYQFNFRQSCFCGPDIIREKTIFVVDDIITEAFYTDSSEYLTVDELSRLLTIDERFDYIQNRIDEGVDELIVIYNATYGYPEEIHVDYWRNAIDDEVSFYISDFM